MKRNPIIKITASILLYAVVLYYLLPFHPLYIYFSSHNNSNGVGYESGSSALKTRDNSFILTGQFHHNKNTFLKNNRVRIYVDSFFITHQPDGSPVSFTKEETQAFTEYRYQNPLVYCNSNRGPPIV